MSRGFLDLIRDRMAGDADRRKAAMNPAARRNAALALLAKRLARTPPDGMVIAAGSTGSIPATARLLAAIARSAQRRGGAAGAGPRAGREKLGRA